MKTAVRGALLSFSADPLREEADSCMQYEPDGIVLTGINHATETRKKLLSAAVPVV